MAHEIFGDRFLSRGESAWHGLGRVFHMEDQMDLVEATNEVAKDISVTKKPLIWLDDEGAQQETNLYGVVREGVGNPELFGTVTDRYAIHQYPEYAEALNSLSKVYPVETAGILEGGRKMFFTLRGEDMDVVAKNGTRDPIKNYFAGVVSQEPGKGHNILHTPVRIVCANTLSAAMDNNDISINIAHEQNAPLHMKFAADVVSNMKAAQQETQAVFQAMALHNIPDGVFEEVLKAAFPLPPVPRKVKLLKGLSPEELEVLKGGKLAEAITYFELADKDFARKVERVHEIRQGARDLSFMFDQEQPEFAGTMWGAYNAITETSDWRNGRDGNGSSQLFGNRAAEKRRAFTSIRNMMADFNLN